jgi:hypothetical protein
MTVETQKIGATTQTTKPEFVSPGDRFAPSRPSKFAWAVGAVLFVLFIVFVMSQSANMPVGQ